VARSFVLDFVVVGLSSLSAKRSAAWNRRRSAWNSGCAWEWVGILYLPAAYLHLSDAMPGNHWKPSRAGGGRAVRLPYLLSIAFLLLRPRSAGWNRWFRKCTRRSSTTHSPHLDFQRLYVAVMLFAGRISAALTCARSPPQPPPHGLPSLQAARASDRLLPLPAVWLWHRRSLSAVRSGSFNHQQHPDFCAAGIMAYSVPLSLAYHLADRVVNAGC